MLLQSELDPGLLNQLLSDSPAVGAIVLVVGGFLWYLKHTNKRQEISQAGFQKSLEAAQEGHKEVMHMVVNSHEKQTDRIVHELQQMRTNK